MIHVATHALTRETEQNTHCQNINIATHGPDEDDLETIMHPLVDDPGRPS